MYTSSYDKPLIISPVKSNWLQVLIIVSHGLTLLFVVFLLDTPVIVTLSLWLLVTISFRYYFQLHVLKTNVNSVLLAKHTFDEAKHNDTWLINLIEQKHGLIVKLLPSSFISQKLIILNFKDQNNQHYSLLVFNDAIAIEHFRQLKVRLKITKPCA